MEEEIKTEPIIESEIKEEKPKKKKSPVLLIILLLILVFIVGAFVLLKLGQDKKETKKKETTTTPTIVEGTYTMTGNDLQELDLYFLKLENNGKNIVYSPLSIKYALEMLSDGADGESKTQLDSIIGKYSARKYTNSANMSFGNALFVRDTFKDSINKDYIDTLKTTYNAEVITDSFASPTVVNNWVNDKTFKMIPSIVDSLEDQDFVLVNALAIDMEWVNKIRALYDDYIVTFTHENYTRYIDSLTSGTGYHKIKFEGTNYETKSVEIGAIANKYDAVKEIGEDKIKTDVGKAYQEWLDGGACGNPSLEPDVDTYLVQYIKELNENYKFVSSSTDFLFYDDSNVKVFAKDLREYNGVTLQYVGIMPKNVALKEYINTIDAKSLNEILNNIKPIAVDSFKEGVVTEIVGEIPMFSYNYELNLMGDLEKLGVKDVFDVEKANLSKLTKGGAYINEAKHKTNIDFSNDGIKAAAATTVGGKGAADCKFVYNYDVPVETIDLTFNKPFMYLIRDKSTGEVWFTGAVYQPTEIKDEEYDPFMGQ